MAPTRCTFVQFSQTVSTRHVRGAYGVAVFRLTLHGVGKGGDPNQPGGCQNGAQLPAAGQGCLKPWTAIVLAAGDVGARPNQRPALSSDIGSHTGLLGFQTEAALSPLCRGDAVEGDGVAGSGGGWFGESTGCLEAFDIRQFARLMDRQPS